MQKKHLGFVVSTSMILIGAIVAISAAVIPLAGYISNVTTDNRSEASGIDNCCQINRTCTTDSEWQSGWYAYQSDSTCGQYSNQSQNNPQAKKMCVRTLPAVIFGVVVVVDFAVIKEWDKVKHAINSNNRNVANNRAT